MWDVGLPKADKEDEKLAIVSWNKGTLPEKASVIRIRWGANLNGTNGVQAGKQLKSIS